MKNITIDRLLELEKKVARNGELILKGRAGEMDETAYEEFMEGLDTSCNSAMDLIKSSMDEKKFCHLRNTIKSALLAALLTEKRGKALYAADASGELTGMLDTFFFTVLGVLINEEVL